MDTVRARHFIIALRFGTEFLRAHEPVAFGLGVAQLLSLAAIVWDPF